MKIKSTILSALLIAGFAISTSALADRSGGGGSSSRDGGSDHGGIDHGDNGHGEQNNDRDMQSAENSSRSHHRRNATPVSQIGVGEPSNPNNSYNQSKELLRDHR